MCAIIYLVVNLMGLAQQKRRSLRNSKTLFLQDLIPMLIWRK
uniref:Uncharacterized protein n=1 Tax=Arundo donax TaxID=35708 RepID=A0A0A9GBF0_ARUDO